MKRTLCSQCHYPETTCICSTVNPTTSKTQFDILQHPSEVKVAKNTARICKLCLPATNIWVGESSDSFAPLRAELKKETRQVLVLYPEDDAISLDDFIARYLAADNADDITKQSSVEIKIFAPDKPPTFRILLIDGTWKKAYKIWKLNPWLDKYQKIILPDVQSSYDIRKAPRPHHLSTLEALAYTINSIEPEVNTSTLFDSFELMQKHFKKFSTTSHNAD